MVLPEKSKIDRHTLVLTYGPREAEILKETDYLAKKEILPDNRNEILRRGLYACRYLSEVDEQPLMELLSNHLHSITKSNSAKDFAIASSLSFAIYAMMICKYGVLRAETFETIPMNLKTIGQTNLNASKSSFEFDANMRRAFGELATSIDTLYLKNNTLNCTR